jgi:DNA-binding NtrC family response regulator
MVKKLTSVCRSRKIRCLVVETDPNLRVLIAKALRDMGMDVFDTENGREAVVVHCQKPFNLLVLHWFNKRMGGQQILETMKELTDQMPKVIIMTGQASVSMHSPVPVSGFLFKPFDIEKLASVILEAIGDDGNEQP